MKLQLVNGQFQNSESRDLVSELIKVKIKFLENKIATSDNEEEIKSKEGKIISMQNNLIALKKYLDNGNKNIRILSEIEIDF
jgi:hypothetical protein